MHRICGLPPSGRWLKALGAGLCGLAMGAALAQPVDPASGVALGLATQRAAKLACGGASSLPRGARPAPRSSKPCCGASSMPPPAPT